jgi:FMN phosphatase YigB (HAD superfamily)
MALFDVDKTLVYGKKADAFYAHYSRLLEESFAEALGVELIEGIKIIDEHRAKHYGMGEKAFETYNLSMETWYDALAMLDPSKYLEPIPSTNKVIRSLKERNIRIGVITDGPRPLVDKIFAATKIDPSLFDFIIGWERGQNMPKLGSSVIYKNISAKHRLAPHHIMMIGDSLHEDVLPAIAVGLKAVHISSDKNKDIVEYLTLKNIKPLIGLKVLS